MQLIYSILKLNKFESWEARDADECVDEDFNLEKYDLYHEATKSLLKYNTELQIDNDFFNIVEEDKGNLHSSIHQSIKFSNRIYFRYCVSWA